MDRNKIITILATFFILACNTNFQNKKQTVKKVKTDTTVLQIASNPTEKIRENAVIYDTLVFSKLQTEFPNQTREAGRNEFDSYKKFIRAKQKGKQKIIYNKYSKAEVKYLGELMDIKNKNTYHVISDFSVLNMPSPRGRSMIAFIHLKENKIMLYNVNMPEDLPQYIENNILFFKHKKTKIGISIAGGMPPILCIDDIVCN